MPKDMEKHRANCRRWKKENAERNAAYMKKWRAENPEKNRAHRKAYRERHPDRIREQVRAWNKKNPEKLRARSKAQSRKRSEAWRGPIPSKSLRLRVFVYQNGLCKLCGANLHGVPHQLDHITSIADRGTNFSHNLQFICVPCHKKKHKKIAT
jgi:5-methylcytosine-specific restriction endonuclease McrA